MSIESQLIMTPNLNEHIDFTPKSKMSIEDKGFLNHYASRSSSFDTNFDSLETPLKLDSHLAEETNSFKYNLMADFMPSSFKLDLFEDFNFEDLASSSQCFHQNFI